mmetsp:Transcript_13085/g.47759  ORF Transcript_13085/g.47759 Transcript_13085/m.47759 type:complete len:112 (+) Transcript_13085:125-460(+)
MAVAFAPALPARFTAAKPASRTLKSVRAVAPTRRVVVAKSHTVESGEWLSSIAAKYDVSITDLKAANAMEDYDVVFPGQEITIPSKGKSPLLLGSVVLLLVVGFALVFKKK